MGLLSDIGWGFGKARTFAGDAFGSILGFFGSNCNSLKQGYEEGSGIAEERRKQEERKKGMARALTGGELEQAYRDDWGKLNTSFSNVSFPRRLTSSMLLTGAYRR